MTVVKAISRTENRKLGVASTTYAAQVSCPSSCAFKDGGGCYAERGWAGLHLHRLNVAADESGATALEVGRLEAKAIDEMDTVVDRPLRLHTVGDCSTDEIARLVSLASERYMERGGGKVWSYTHAWRDVERASWGQVSVLASCETQADVEAATARGYATAIVVDSFDDRARHEQDGVDILPCPSQTTEGVKCVDCRLCFDDEAIKERGYSIAFAIHGDDSTRKRARATMRSILEVKG